jgi:Tfp pilus assembly protein PilO
MIRRLRQFWPLVRRYPFFGSCAVLSVLFALSAIGLSVRLHTLSGIHQKKLAEANIVQATLRSKPELLKELEFVRQTLQRISENLAKDESLLANQNYFLDMAERCEARLNLSSFNTPPPDTGTEYVRIPFGLKASGTYAQVAAFIHALETGPRVSNITAFSFQRVPGTSNVTVDLNVDLLGKR